MTGTPPDVPAPLSYAQQRMWFYNQLEPESCLYNQVVGGLGESSKPSAGRWIGPLDVEALERSLGEIVRRHEVLRTRFPLTEGGAVQEILPSGSFTLRIEDLTGSPAEEREAAAREWARAESRRGFDLTRDQPLRASLLRLGDNDHVLVLVVHHVAFDRWSKWVLLRELASLYSALVTGRSAALPPPPLQYRDYARRERSQIEGRALDGELAYWRDRLRGMPPVLELPLDRPRPPRQAHRGATRLLPLPASLVERLQGLCRSNRVSLPMVLHSGFHTLLWRWTGRTDIPVGMIVAGRTALECEPLIGCFTNTLVVRVDLSGDPTFRELIARVRNTTLEAYSYQRLPFERLVEELRPDRNARYHPLFQVLFNYLDVPRAEIDFPEIRVHDFQVSPRTAPVDLSLDVERRSEGLFCHFTYDADLFEAVTVDRIAEDYQVLLEAMAADPGKRLSALLLPLADVGATRRLVAELEEMSDDEAARLLLAEEHG